jgi:hypothetical protein
MLHRPWTSFAPTKQRWIVYKHMLMLRDGATTTAIQQSIAAHYQTEVHLRWVDQTLRQFRHRGMTRWVRCDDAGFWHPTEKRSTENADRSIDC